MLHSISLSQETSNMLTSLVLTALAASYVDARLMSSGQGYINYTTVTGYFLQDDPSTNATSFNYVSRRCLPVLASC